MPAQLTYAPAAWFEPGTTEYTFAARKFGQSLEDKEIPACVIRRPADMHLEVATGVSEELIKENVLPVVELRTGDRTAPVRNLVESCVLGTLDLAWDSGKEAFEDGDLLELLNGTGRHRLPLDLVLRFRGSMPGAKAFKSLLKKAGEFTGKYGHVQIVKLAEIPRGEGESSFADEAGALFRMILDICPRSHPAVAPSLWINHPSLRSMTGDLGLIPIRMEDFTKGGHMSNELKAAEYLAKQLGLPSAPRLPLVPRFFSKGWHSFEVGKVLDSWIDRRAFRVYRERPGWLED